MFWKCYYFRIGVLLKHENVVAAMTGQRERVFPIIDVDNYVYIAYLPLAHILELSCGSFFFLFIYPLK